MTRDEARVFFEAGMRAHMIDMDTRLSRMSLILGVGGMAIFLFITLFGLSLAHDFIIRGNVIAFLIIALSIFSFMAGTITVVINTLYEISKRDRAKKSQGIEDLFQNTYEGAYETDQV